MSSERPHVCLFVGPSLGAERLHHECSRIPARLTLRPPIQQGDLLQLSRQLPDVVGIVDGYFQSVPAVLHKEILWMLGKGVRVLGAASLGALRAAELDGFGMEGVGEIYRLYRSGVIEGDDEVALLHSEAAGEYRPLTVPLVNLRAALADARQAGLVSATTSRRVIRAARRLGFPQRSREAILEGARELGAPDGQLKQLTGYCADHPHDLKAEDTVLLVRTIARRLTGEEPWPRTGSIRLNRTVYFHLFEREYRGEAAAGEPVPDSQVLSFQKLLDDDFADRVRAARRRRLRQEQARRLELTPASDRQLLERFRSEGGLADGGALDRWLQTRRLSGGELLRELREQDLEAKLEAAGEPVPELPSEELSLLEHLPTLCRPGVPDETTLLVQLKLDGRFQAAADEAAEIVRLNRSLSKPLAGLAEALSEQRLESWATHLWGVDPKQLDSNLRSRGFLTYREFLQTAARAYIARRLAASR